MFGLGIRYLMNWAMAAVDGAKKERAEWPPHPDRIFMALAAAWFETGQDVEEGKALHWLEELGPSGICASDREVRTTVTSYVPVNDASFRPLKPRSFPVAIPHEPVVHLVWKVDIPEAYLTPLVSLCRKVISIGHSASLIQMWLTTSPPDANLVPTNGVARYRLRIFGPGRLRYLEARCNRSAVIAFHDGEEKIKNAAKGKEKKRLQEQQQIRFPAGSPVSLRPEPGLWQGYDKPKQCDPTPPSCSLFDPRLVVLALSGKRLSLSATLKVTEAFRGALLAACTEPIPEWISGHTPDHAPTKKPHVALLPLPFSGSEYADGRLMGIALAIPRELDPAEVDCVLTHWLWDEHGESTKIRLFNGQWFECAAALETRESPPVSLRSETWTDSSRRWATVTPLVLDRHFDGKDKWERAAESVKDGCERMGLPRPAEVLLHPVSMFEGVPCSNEFPWMTRKRDGGRMYHIHGVIIFNEDVQGPVIVGAGRFRGYGFCRPMKQGGTWDD